MLIMIYNIKKDVKHTSDALVLTIITYCIQLCNTSLHIFIHILIVLSQILTLNESGRVFILNLCPSVRLLLHDLNPFSAIEQSKLLGIG